MKAFMEMASAMRSMSESNGAENGESPLAALGQVAALLNGIHIELKRLNTNLETANDAKRES